MANRYQMINDLNGQFLILIKHNIISLNLMTWHSIYSTYLDLLKNQKKSEAKKTLSVHYDMSLRNIQKIIKYMSEETTI